MVKHDFLTPKAIANRMKSKGLQKLRWYCQVCQKQCRDENGFKCHTMSDSHQRQMLLVANNPDRFMNAYSEMFEKAFMDLLRRRHGTKRMLSNIVYNEYIAHKEHIHMNATHWASLTSFVQYLGRTGKCVVDETEKGWYISYIDRDPRAIARQESLKKKAAEKDHEDTNRRFIERQVKASREAAEARGEADATFTGIQRSNDEKVKVNLFCNGGASRSSAVARHPITVAEAFTTTGTRMSETKGETSGTKRKTAMEEIMATEKMRRVAHQKSLRKENWMYRGIVVKVMNKELASGDYYKKKGLVERVENKFLAEISILDSGDRLKVDQDQLETVIPKVGGCVKVVNGVGRGARAELLSLDTDNYCASVRLLSGKEKGRIVEKVEYEDICKFDEEWYERHCR